MSCRSSRSLPVAATRRAFVQHLLWTGFGTYVAVAAGCRKRSGSTGGAIPRTLRAAELAAVAAICERLLPADEDPGAIALGVPAFVDAVLADVHYEGWREEVHAGLARLDDECQVRHGCGFADAAMSDEDRDQLLAAWQSSPDPQNAGLFDKLLHLTIEGAFADPIHGGNRDGAAWRLIGFESDDCAPKKKS